LSKLFLLNEDAIMVIKTIRLMFTWWESDKKNTEKYKIDKNS